MYVEDFKKFTAARIAVPILSAPDLKVGQSVEIEYYQTRINPGQGGIEMPIYKVKAVVPEEREAQVHYLFACALKDYR